MFDKDSPPDWFGRLADAIEAKRREGMSYAEISRAAGQKDTYVSELLRKKVDPSVSAFLGLLRAIDTSAAKILYNIDITPEIEQVISIIGRQDPALQAQMVDLATRMAQLATR
jgi:transcriptional regulator with XRE-family HTH domain